MPINIFGDNCLTKEQIAEIEDIEEVKPGCYIGFYGEQAVLMGGALCRPWQFLSS